MSEDLADFWTAALDYFSAGLAWVHVGSVSVIVSSIGIEHPLERRLPLNHVTSGRSVGTMRGLASWLNSRPVIERVVNTTIMLMCVLVIYDGWEELRLIGVVGVIVGPVLAMFLAHVFAASIGQEVDLERTPTGRERMKIVRDESRFLLVAVPPVAVVVVLSLGGVSLSDCIQVVLWMGLMSLGFWGGVAGRRAGFTGWNLALSVGAGLLVGGIVLGLQVLLRPGAAGPDGIEL